jgi:hypothetical protein
MLQGIFPGDHPYMRRLSEMPGHATLLADIAGNAFSTTVALAVTIASLIGVPLSPTSALTQGSGRWQRWPTGRGPSPDTDPGPL